MKPLLPACVAACMALLCALPLHAQEADAMRAVRLAPGEKIVLDGTLSHPAWQRAPVFQRFIEKDPVNGAAPPQATRVQLLFDEQALYVGVTALDTQPELIRDVLVRNDQVNRTQDFVSVFIDAIGNKQSAQFFRVNAAGSTADGMYTSADDSEDFSPDFDWDAASARNPQGWTAVMRLPFAALRFAHGGHEHWRIMVVRRLPREQFHLVASVPIPRDAPSFIHNLQPLRGLTLPENPQFLTVRPSVTLRSARENGASGNETEPSLDVKWRPRAELVIDGTLKPDFSQVALDVPQLAGNSRFALYFPEKRPFFFESADLLRTPTDAFYTRSYTAPRWGLRGTWRGPVLAGSAFFVDDRGGGFVLIPRAYDTGYADQPASRSLAASVHYGQGAVQGGGMLAVRRYEGGVGENTVLGPDLNWQVDEAWRVRGQWLHSQTSAFTEGRTDGGDRWFLKAQRLTDDAELYLTLDESSAGFRHDTGFVNQVGVRRAELFTNRGWHGLGPFNEFYINIKLEQVRERSSGLLVSQVLRPGLWSSAARNLEWWLEVYAQSQVRTAPDKPLLQEHYVATGLVMTPATWFPIIDTNIALGRLADTAANQVRPGGRWKLGTKLRLLPRLELEPSVELAWLKNDGKLVYRESALQGLAVWHFDARQNLRAIFQRGTLDRRAEPKVDAQQGTNQATSLTYTWRQSAGTVLYVGASRSRDGASTATRVSEAFVKLQFDAGELAQRFW